VTIRRTIWLGVVLLAAGAAIYGGIYLSRPVVAVSSATVGPAVQAVYATGVVEPVTWAKVAPLVRGRIVELCACEGDEVARDHVLARLDDTEARAELAELEAREAFLASEVQRYRNLLEHSVVSTQVYERTNSELQQIRSAIRAQRKRLDDLQLRAPMAGMVLRRDGEVGEIVDSSDILFWVGQPRPLQVVAEVDEEDIPQVHPGQEVLIDADAFPGRELAGEVSRITPKGDPVNKSYRVRVALPDDTPLLIGMTVEVNVIAREVPDAVLVPATSLSGGYVFLARDGRAVRQAVETGIRGSEMVEITVGLSAGDPVIREPAETLEDGQRIRIESP